MADKKISALTAAATPLSGSEVLPIVQGGATVKVSVDDLTTGKLVTTGPIVSVGVGKDRLVIEPQNAGSGALILGTNSAGNAYTPVLIDGSLTKLSVGGVEVARTNSNGIAPVAGKGIDFSANTGLPGATSELLDWYEEGTWAIADTSGAGLTLTVDHAKYTRVGNLVTVNAYVTYPVTANASANQLSLPYTAAKYDIGTAGASTGNVYSAITIGGGAQMSVRNLSLQPLLNSNLSGADVLISFTYMV